MNPRQAAKELLESLGDGQHVLRTHSPSYIEYRRHRADMRQIFLALALLTEYLREGVENTQLQGWVPELVEGPDMGLKKDELFLGWDGGSLRFRLTSEGILYTYRNAMGEGSPFGPITRMVGETLAEAATRLVFQVLQPVYAPGLFSGSV